MKNLLILAALFLLMMVLPVDALMAQSPPPPALPGMPDQAPLGGLGLLAAAGGAYAWSKLRNRQNQG